MRLKQKKLIEDMARALSCPPAKAGMRLRSERELASLFGVCRTTIRQALGALEERGILAQQRGSGTYLRYVPQAGRRRRGRAVSAEPASEQLFVPEEKPKGHGAVSRRRTRLNLQLWTHLHSFTPSLELQLQSFKEAVAASGHALKVVGITTAERCFLPRERLQTMLDEDPCDGYLLAVTVADYALDLFEAADKPFIVLGAEPPVRHEPSVLTDTVEAIERAVPLLAREGYRRIALLSYAGAAQDNQQVAYARAMRRASLDYRCLLTSDVVSPDESRNILSLQLRSAEPPDAVYVADDNLLPGVALALDDFGLTPGRDFGVIAMTIRGLPVPAGPAWSQMQFRPQWHARCVLDNLLDFMCSSDHEPFCQALYCHWVPGDTHKRHRARKGGGSGLVT